MAQQHSNQDTLDFASLTDAIIPSASYLNSWSKTAPPRSSDSASFSFGNAFPSPSTTETPMQLRGKATPIRPMYDNSTISQSDATLHDQARGVGDALHPISPADLAQIQIARTPARTPTGQQFQATVTTSRSEAPESKTPSALAKDPLAALKMRAKESIMVKRAGSIRSGSSDSKAGPTEVHDAHLTQKGRSNDMVMADEQDSKSQLANSSMRALSLQVSKPLGGAHDTLTKATSTELDDLLAEGRAAASLVTPTTDQNRCATEGPLGHRELQSPGEQDVLEAGEIQVGNSRGNLVSPVTDHQSKVEHFPADEIDEIDTWLSMTGYYDKSYRDKVLNRRRRLQEIADERFRLLQEIEDERLRLLKEEMEDQQHRTTFNNTTPLGATQGLTGPVTQLRPAAPMVKHDLGLRIKDSALKTSTNSDVTMSNHDAPVKRGIEKAMNDTPTLPRAKAARTDEQRMTPPRSQWASPERRNNRSLSPVSVRRHVAPAPHRQSLHYKDGHDRGSRESQLDRLDRRGPMDRSLDENSTRRNEYRERDDLRDGTGLGTSIRLKSDMPGDRVRFFLLKSWNYENIVTAQREGTWATQTKNEDTFIEAFKTCRHVIFFFSANHSKAFQGYARMQSLPGERGVTEPSWVKNLHWPTTAPFRLRWIVKEETHYRAVGNLRNPLNENLAIFVGRDGQEIPEKLGLQLCDIIDEDTAYRADSRR